MTPPNNEELEVSVFGPGFGESVLVHVGLGRWIIVDSCISSESGNAAALSYFRRIGVDPRSAVRLVVATHWHDDHMAGISELLEACEDAQFSCAAPLAELEFLELMALFNVRSSSELTGLSEIQRIFSLLAARRQVPVYAMADRPLLFLPSIGSLPSVTVTALSPVDAEYHRFLQSLPQLFPGKTTTKFRFPDVQHNDLSIAIWIDSGPVSLLLGADLEEHGVSHRGWSAVLASATRPTGEAAFFKIAHHGSHTGHHDGVWQTMLTRNVVAVLTPWNRGRTLPQDTDCQRINSLTSQAYATARQTRGTTPRIQAVQKTLRESGIRITAAEAATGLVRARMSLTRPGDALSTWLSPEACSLSNYM